MITSLRIKLIQFNDNNTIIILISIIITQNKFSLLIIVKRIK